MPEGIALAYAQAVPVKAPPMVYEPRWSVWGSAYGGTAQVDGNAAIGSTTTDSRVGGFAAGADYRLARDTAIGFALAGGGTSWSLANGLGSGQSDVFQTGVYGSHRFGPAYLSAALAYAWHDATTTRNVTIGAETLEGRFRPHVLAGRVEGGYRFGWMGMGVTPYAAAQVQSFRMPAYTETATAGAGTFALSYASQTDTATRTELGLWADYRSWLSPHTELVLRGRAAWAHDFDTDRRINPGFAALPGASFTVDGASASPDLALLSAVAELRLRSGVSLSAKFDGEFGSRSESYAATGTFRYSW
jgi:outer membrane autotransporter protein